MFRVINVAAEPAWNPNVRSGTKGSAVMATAVRTNGSFASMPGEAAPARGRA
jgi:hypothetical protein